eukprot:232075_1
MNHRLSLEGANLLTAEPLLGEAGAVLLGVPSGNVGHGPAEEDQEAADEAKATDDGVLALVLLELAVVLGGVLGVGGHGEGLVDEVAEGGLEADVDEAEDGQDLVDHGVADLGAEVGGNEHVLDGLEELHGEEEEDADRELAVGGVLVDPVGEEKAEGSEAAGHVAVEAHC